MTLFPCTIELVEQKKMIDSCTSKNFYMANTINTINKVKPQKSKY